MAMWSAIAKIVMMEVTVTRIMIVMMEVTVTRIMMVMFITMFMVVATGTRYTGILRHQHQQIALIQYRRPILVAL